MKRGRISRITDSNIQVDYSGPSFSDLPPEILQNILFKLPAKSVVVCKYVCKTWHDLISDPEFAKLHFDETCDRVHPRYYISDSKSEPEKPYQLELIKLGRFEHTYSTQGCLCNGKLALDSKFELPLLENDKYRIVNSCNGVLCFSPRAYNVAVIICNPVLGEFISVPIDKKAHELYLGFTNYGFGFSHVPNKYKIVRIISNGPLGSRSIARVHIVGTETWRDMNIELPYFHSCLPIYVKGFIYWFACPMSIPFFDVENEYFGSDSGPKQENPGTNKWSSLGVLAGELSISIFTCFETFQVWAMKGNGVEKIWSQVLSIKLGHGNHIDHLQPMKYLSDGSLLMFNVMGMALVVDPRKSEFRYFYIRETISKASAISLFSHIPGLISLKHLLSGKYTKVLDLRSR